VIAEAGERNEGEGWGILISRTQIHLGQNEKLCTIDA
jgi:hypothetical protein